MLITFMIGDLLLVSKTLVSPAASNLLGELDEKNYGSVKDKILTNQARGEITYLSLRESVFLYLLVDMACKCFIDDTNETLKNLAVKNVKVSEEEYEQLRINFLRYGQFLIEIMNEKFQTYEIFRTAFERLRK